MENHGEGAAFVVYPDSKGPTWDLAGTTDLDFMADILWQRRDDRIHEDLCARASLPTATSTRAISRSSSIMARSR